MRVIGNIFKKVEKLSQPRKYLSDTGITPCHLSPLKVTQTSHVQI